VKRTRRGIVGSDRIERKLRRARDWARRAARAARAVGWGDSEMDLYGSGWVWIGGGARMRSRWGAG
jgi:hypothetical protein